MNIARFVVLVTSLVIGSVQAQTIYRPFAQGVKQGQPAPQVCKDVHAVIAPLVRQYPHPDTWTWIIACDEWAWNQLIQHLGYDGADMHIMALTDQRSHITYIRGSAILNPGLGEDTQPKHIIAHELAHIYLRSNDEQEVDNQALQWEKQFQTIAKKE